MIAALAIVGPTASGKSALALRVAQRVGGEIVSVDSRQAYRGLDIGTAKPSAADRAAIPHHLVDILDPAETSNAETYARLAHEAIRTIASRGKLPVIVGGSGLYFRAIRDGLFSIELIPSARAAFAQSVAAVPDAELRRRLSAVDAESARRIHPNDRYRIVRALEVYELTGMPLSEHLRLHRSERPERGVRFVAAGLELPRHELHRRIDERTEGMLRGGWVDEVRGLLEGGADPDWPGMRTLGYPDIVEHILGDTPIAETAQRIRERTHQYAKRQITWFKKEADVIWLRADDTKTGEELLRLARSARSAKEG